MNDCDTSNNEESIDQSSSSRKLRSSRIGDKADKKPAIDVLAPDSHSASAVDPSQSKTRVTTAKEQKAAQMLKDEKKAASEADGVMDLTMEESELSDVNENDLATSRVTTIQRTCTVQSVQVGIAAMPSKITEARGTKRAAPVDRFEELEEEEEPSAPVPRSSKKAKSAVDAPTSKPLTSDSETSKTSRASKKPINTYVNKSRQRGKKNRDSGLGMSTSSKRGTSGEEDKSDTDYDMPGVQKVTKANSKAAVSKAKDRRSRPGREVKKEVIVASSTPKVHKVKPAAAKITVAKERSPWREENSYAAAAEDELPEPLYTRKPHAQTLPTDSDPIEPATSDRGSSRKPKSVDKTKSNKPVTSLSQLCAINDVPVKQQKQKPALTFIESASSAKKPISKDAQKTENLRPASTRSDGFAVDVLMSEAAQTGDQAIDDAFGDLLDPAPIRESRLPSTRSEAQILSRSTPI